jgi:hypothetical protein
MIFVVLTYVSSDVRNESSVSFRGNSGFGGLSSETTNLNLLDLNVATTELRQLIRYSNGLRARVRFSIGEIDSSLPYSVQTGSGDHPAYDPKGTVAPFHEGKAVGT